MSGWLTALKGGVGGIKKGTPTQLVPQSGTTPHEGLLVECPEETLAALAHVRPADAGS